MVSICMEEELSRYNLDGKWNDYVGIQKEVISVLKEGGYFNIADIVNCETGMNIRFTAKGVKETIGKGKRFQNLPKRVKQQKVATPRVLPLLIKEGTLREDNVKNYHEDSDDFFAYFQSRMLIDGETHDVRISVKKKINSNHFYIHHVDTEKSSELLSPSKKTEITRFRTSN